MKKIVMLSQNDYDIIMSTLRNVRYDLSQLPDSYYVNNARGNIEEIGRILTYDENQTEEE
ncbi:MAG: hypothetical protein ACI4GX_05620 [Ruminococcus sp.]